MTFNGNNPHLTDLADDALYHFGISKNQFDFKKMFNDVKFVCIGGSSHRFKMYASLFSQNSGLPLIGDISQSDRFCLYKTGPVLWANHGMGVPSLSIMLNEMFKLLQYAGVTDVTFIRLGTSGGVGIQPGTVVISNGAVNSQLRESYDLDINGKLRSFPCKLDQKVADELYSVAMDLKYIAEKGKTLCANDFYEGQMRLDGYFSPGEVEEKFEFLRKIKQAGIKNIEMEATAFSAMTHRAGIKGAIVCVALVNRMNGDQIQLDKALYKDYELRPFNIVTKYILAKLGIVTISSPSI